MVRLTPSVKNVLVLAFVALTFALAPVPATENPQAPKSSDEVRGNSRVENFASAKHILKKLVYTEDADRVTLYCGVTFNENHTTNLPEGFKTSVYQTRAKHIEWEHVVPAENFGRNFKAWSQGDPSCTHRGRACAERVDQTFRYIESDLYNLYPAIGAVNAVRSNYEYTELPYAKPRFGSCAFKVEGKLVEPPDRSKGAVARTWLYMLDAYPKYLSATEAYKALMVKWNADFPIQAWECKRAKRIEELQKNANPYVKNPCLKLGLYTNR